MAIYRGPKINNNGLVLALDAANTRSYPGSGTTWFDLSGNGRNFTLQNSPTHDGTSMVFNGSNQYATLVDTDLANELVTNFTVNVTLNFNTSGGQYGIFTKGNSFGSGWTIYYRQGPQFSMIGHDATTDTSTGLLGATPSGGISENNWYNLVYVVDGQTVKSYINGSFINSSTFTDSFINQNSTFNIGWDVSLGNPDYFPGRISNLMVYNRVLSVSEIQNNFNVTKGRFGL